MTAQQHETTATGPVRLYDAETGCLVTKITPRELRQLQDALEEEFPEDHDYYINADTLDYLAAREVDARVVDALRQAMGTREGFDVLWRAGAR